MTTGRTDAQRPAPAGPLRDLVEVRDAVARRDDLIRQARAEGHSLAVIAEAAGLTFQRVHQIVTDK